MPSALPPLPEADLEGALPPSRKPAPCPASLCYARHAATHTAFLPCQPAPRLTDSRRLLASQAGGSGGWGESGEQRGAGLAGRPVGHLIRLE